MLQISERCSCGEFQAGLRGPAVAVGRRSLLPRMWVPGSRAQTGATNPIRVQEVVRRPEYQEGEAVETPTAPVATGAKILDNRKVRAMLQWPISSVSGTTCFSVPHNTSNAHKTQTLCHNFLTKCKNPQTFSAVNLVLRFLSELASRNVLSR